MIVAFSYRYLYASVNAISLVSEVPSDKFRKTIQSYLNFNYFK